MRFLRVLLSVAVASLAAIVVDGAMSPPAATTPAFVSRAKTPPRKVVVGSAVADFSGSVHARLQLASQLIDQAAREAAERNPGHGLDLMVLPEFAICEETGTTAAERAVSLAGPVLDTLGGEAREHHAWLVVPMTLRETDRISNAAVLIDRAGKVAGIFRKVHPVADDAGVLEGGVTPGNEFPVFNTDFGRLGIMICWDTAYEES
ncbi:MAG TPA: carbon-nitrogen hydrolase family protein [Candidatus Didemnitutus sp.]|jgi:predicted amidohydrolase